MRKIREILRLKWECHCSHLLIARSTGVSSSTVSECLRRATSAQLSWPLPAEMGEEALIQLLYPSSKTGTSGERGEIDWVHIHQELKRKHVTRMLLWQEYKTQHPKGLSYSRFCECYQAWCAPLDVWMRQTYKAGEKCFVDYSGTRMPVVVDTNTGETREAEIFVAALGASSLTFTEATWTQQLPDWIQSHVHAFEFFSGVPEILVPDNLRSGVKKAHRYEPDVNPTYQDMAIHYGVAVLPARIYSPKDKSRVENAVLQVERKILAKLRNHRFFSLYELNQAMRPLLNDLNRCPFQKIPGSRQSQFECLEKAALKPLPSTRYVFAEWKKVRAGADYHVELEGHYYSVPYQLTKKEVDVRYTQQTVEVFYKSKRVASHRRNSKKDKHTTTKEHMPKRHQQHAEWTPERILRWAQDIGKATEKLLEIVMQSRAHPQQGLRSCLGILRLSKSYGEVRLESACQHAVNIGTHTYKSIESILKNALDQVPRSSTSDTTPVPTDHEYVRGQKYFT